MARRIAIIGGGLQGCLTALMLAKRRNPDGSKPYDITIFEAAPALLSGASVVAFRQHLGGEYIGDPETMHDCVLASTVHTLVLPRTIYTQTERMKFMIASPCAGDGAELPTMDKFDLAYEKHARERYQRYSQRVDHHLGPVELFGSAEPGRFYHRLNDSQLQHHTCVVSGFQTQEPGIDVYAYLDMIRRAIAAQENVHVVLNQTIGAPAGALGDFTIVLQDGQRLRGFDQIVQAAWEGGPALTPLHQNGTVFMRGIMLVDLASESVWPPVFILCGKSGTHGGMFAPVNDRLAVCYLPTSAAGHIDAYPVTGTNGRLPRAPRRMRGGLTARAWCERYFELLKERFPFVLGGAKNPRLFIRYTLNFGNGNSSENKTSDDITRRRNLDVLEINPGKFIVYPTKASYCAYLAVQAAYMVQMREAQPDDKRIASPADVLGLVLANREAFSLAAMLQPETAYPQRLLNTPAAMYTHYADRGGRQLREILDAADVPINCCSADKRFLFVNRAYANWYKRAPQELIGTSVRDLVGYEGFNTICPYVERALQGERVHYKTEVNLSIGRHSIECRYTPIRNGKGSVSGWVGVIHAVAA